MPRAGGNIGIKRNIDGRSIKIEVGFRRALVLYFGYYAVLCKLIGIDVVRRYADCLTDDISGGLVLCNRNAVHAGFGNKGSMRLAVRERCAAVHYILNVLCGELDIHENFLYEPILHEVDGVLRAELFGVGNPCVEAAVIAINPGTARRLFAAAGPLHCN